MFFLISEFGHIVSLQNPTGGGKSFKRKGHQDFSNTWKWGVTGSPEKKCIGPRVFLEWDDGSTN